MPFIFYAWMCLVSIFYILTLLSMVLHKLSDSDTQNWHLPYFWVKTCFLCLYWMSPRFTISSLIRYNSVKTKISINISDFHVKVNIFAVMCKHLPVCSHIRINILEVMYKNLSVCRSKTILKLIITSSFSNMILAWNQSLQNLSILCTLHSFNHFRTCCS